MAKSSASEVSLDELRSRVTKLTDRRTEASEELARGEGAHEQARAVLKRLGASSVKEARTMTDDLDTRIAKLKASLARRVEDIEERLEEANAD